MGANTSVLVNYITDYDASDGTTDFDAVDVSKYEKGSITVETTGLDSDASFISVEGRNGASESWETLVDDAGVVAQLGVSNINANNILSLESLGGVKFIRVHWEAYTASSGTFSINIHLKTLN